MKRLLAVIIFLAIAVPLMAEKDKSKEWLTAKLQAVQTQDMQSGSYNNASNVNDTGRMVGGSFSNAPTHFVIYNIVIETEEEVIRASLSREISYRPPDLRIGSDIQYKLSGPKFIEVKDAAGKKYEFKVTKREKKQAAQPSQPAQKQ